MTQLVSGLIQINECRIFRVPGVVKVGHAKIINRNDASSYQLKMQIKTGNEKHVLTFVKENNAHS